jgi:hypothetical protein
MDGTFAKTIAISITWPGAGSKIYEGLFPRRGSTQKLQNCTLFQCFQWVDLLERYQNSAKAKAMHVTHSDRVQRLCRQGTFPNQEQDYAAPFH